MPRCRCAWCIERDMQKRGYSSIEIAQTVIDVTRAHRSGYVDSDDYDDDEDREAQMDERERLLDRRERRLEQREKQPESVFATQLWEKQAELDRANKELSDAKSAVSHANYMCDYYKGQRDSAEHLYKRLLNRRSDRKATSLVTYLAAIPVFGFGAAAINASGLPVPMEMMAYAGETAVLGLATASLVGIHRKENR